MKDQTLESKKKKIVARLQALQPTKTQSVKKDRVSKQWLVEQLRKKFAYQANSSR